MAGSTDCELILRHGILREGKCLLLHMSCGHRRSGDRQKRASSESLPRDLTLTVWISLWRAQIILPLESIDATGSSRPILIITAPSSKPIATLRAARQAH